MSRRKYVGYERDGMSMSMSGVVSVMLGTYGDAELRYVRTYCVVFTHCNRNHKLTSLQMLRFPGES